LDWVVASISSAVLFSLVSVLEKRILAVHVPGIMGFYFLVGIIQFGMAAVIALLVPWHGGEMGSIVMAAFSGGLGGASLLALFYGFRHLDVSRAVPIFHTFPVFVAIMAVAFLDEQLSLVHWIAILVVVIGAGLVMIGQPQMQSAGVKKIAFAAVAFSSFAMAVSTITTKVALDQMETWDVFIIRSIFLGAVLLIPTLQPHGLRQGLVVLSNRRATTLILLTEGVLAGAAICTMLLAFELGPVSLASTLMSTRPVMVLFMSALLSTRVWNLLDEPLTRDTWAVKFVSAVLVVGGVGVLSLA
jgi:uncharacterized membrane protein